MCGRFYLDARADEIESTLGLTGLSEFQPRYNIAPSQPIFAVVLGNHGREGHWFRWGLIPSWAKDEKFGYHTINARAETVAQKPAFRSAFRHRRALIPASGYFEWRSEASGKQPYCIKSADSPLLVFAGLYEHWESPQGETIDSCTIIVTDAAPSIEAIHDRMPLCLAPTQFGDWLDPALQDPDRLLSLVKAAKAPVMTFYPVTRRMNNPRYDRSDAIESVT
jgi:putative SOS response-associated peptidase YedK